MLFSRRPRSSEEKRHWGLHVLACESEECEWSYETDRAAFLGRLRGATDPVAVERGGELGRHVGPVLDPACSLRAGADVGPGESARLVFTTGVADDRDTAVQLVEKYRDARSAQRAIDLAWTATQLELRDLGITPDEAVTLERLASRLLLTDPSSRLKVKTPVENELQMSGLWSIGISGDYPILLVRVEELEHAPLVRQAILAHQYWRHKGLVADLVILNTRPPPTPTSSTTACGCSCGPGTRCSSSTSRAASTCGAPTRCTPTSRTCCSRSRERRSKATAARSSCS